MNVQLKTGQEYTEPKSGYSFIKGFGRIRNLNMAIISGEMAAPEDFRAQASAGIAFYNDSEAAISGAQPLYTINMNFVDTELIAILDINETTGYSISEKKVYDVFLSKENYSELFELI